MSAGERKRCKENISKRVIKRIKREKMREREKIRERENIREREEERERKRAR